MLMAMLFHILCEISVLVVINVKYCSIIHANE